MTIQTDLREVQFFMIHFDPEYICQAQTVVGDRNHGSVFVGNSLHSADAVHDLLSVFAIKRQQTARTPVIKIIEIA